MLRTLDEIREAGARAVANFPPLTPQQIDTVALLISPAPIAPGITPVRPKPRALPLLTAA